MALQARLSRQCTIFRARRPLASHHELGPLLPQILPSALNLGAAVPAMGTAVKRDALLPMPRSNSQTTPAGRRTDDVPFWPQSLALLWLLMLLHGPARAGEASPFITIEAELTPSQSLITGSVTPHARWPELCLWLPANRSLLNRPETDSISHPWRFPSEVSGSSMRTVARGGANGSVACREPDEFCSLGLKGGIGLGDGPANVEFETIIPERFGPFGRVGSSITLLGGWYPVPWACQWEQGQGNAARRAIPARVCASSVESGLLILGRRVAYVAPGEELCVEVDDVTAPLLMAFREEATVTSLVDARGSRWLTVAKDPSEVRSRVSGALARALERVERRSPLPGLLLQAPLREMIALPFPGGILISDRFLAATPLAAIVSRHMETLGWAVAAFDRLEDSTPYWDALLLGLLDNVLTGVKGSQGASLRDLFRKGEFVSTVDQIGTDPQTGFQQALFSMASSPEELRALAISPGNLELESPWVVASQLVLALSRSDLGQGLEERGPGVVGGLMERLEARAPGLAQALSKGRAVDIALGRATAESVEVLATPDPGPLMVEALFHGSERSTHFCLKFPCQIPLPDGRGEGDILIDPGERLLQRGKAGVDPRLNDRNYADMKLMISKLYVSMGSEDSIPFASAELLLQRRYDLSLVGHLTPFVGPVRSGAMGGLRWGLGRAHRANSRTTYLGLAPRVAVDTHKSELWSAGLMATLLYTTYQSRTNPFDSELVYAYMLPFMTNGAEAGLRFGASGTMLVGSTPDHVLALRLSADGAVGTIPDFEKAYSGGTEGVRALAAQGTGRRHKASSTLEYRFMLVRGCWASLAGLAWFEGLQLAAFVDAALIADSPGELVNSAALFAGAGVGLRPHVQLFGIVPAMMTVDMTWLLPFGGAGAGGAAFLIGFAQPL